MSWKKWVNVTEEERENIAKIAAKYDIYIGAVAGLFQGGMTFEEIEQKLKSENGNRAIAVGM